MPSWVSTPRKKRAGAELRTPKQHSYTLRIGRNRTIRLLADDAREAYRKAFDVVRAMMPSIYIYSSPLNTKQFVAKDGIVVATLSGYGCSDGKQERREKQERAARVAARIAKYGK